MHRFPLLNNIQFRGYKSKQNVTYCYITYNYLNFYKIYKILFLYYFALRNVLECTVIGKVFYSFKRDHTMPPKKAVSIQSWLLALYLNPTSQLDFIHLELEPFSAVPVLQTGSQTFSDIQRLTDIKKSLEKI